MTDDWDIGAAIEQGMQAALDWTPPPPYDYGPDIARLKEQLRMTKWDTRFMEMARLVASWSKDPSTKCGAVAVDDEHRVLGLGYNGFPRGVHDEDARYADRAVKYKMVVHAEANAVLNSFGGVSGATLYSTKFPCSECAKLIVQSGVTVVVCPASNGSPSDERRAEDAAFARQMLGEGGVVVREL